MAASEDYLQLTHVFLARIRCLQECIRCFKDGLHLPEAICYVCDQCPIKATKHGKITLHASPEPSKQTGGSDKPVEVLVGPEDVVYVSGEEYCNSVGQWAAIRRIVLLNGTTRTFESTLWLLVCSAECLAQDKSAFVTGNNVQASSQKERLFGREQRTVCRWEDVVDTTYCLHLNDHRPVISAVDKEAVDRLREPPAGWSMNHDEELAQFLCGETFSQSDVAGNLGCIRDYVESIAVSSYSEEDRGAESLTDNDPDTFWESDGSQGNHWIRMQMKSETVIKTLSILVDGYDDNYLPRRIIVTGGRTGSMKKLNEVTIDQDLHGVSSVLLLDNLQEHYPVIEIKINECKDEGIDTRVHAVKIQSSKERDFGLNRDLFNSEHMIRFPMLECYSTDQRYRRALLLQRFTQLLDSVLPYIVPSWEFSVNSYSWLEVIRQLLPMSKKRTSLIDVFLRQSETSEPPLMLPKLYVNRRSAVDHRLNPTLDPQYKNSVFSQIYEGLKPRDPSEKPMDFRWPGRYSQWWECKFLDEGIIDQGGGFRDSLSDLAEELCPSAQEVPVPLPFFIRSPNQSNLDANVNRDMYVPNPSCTELNKYEWIGKVMGACLRGKENLVLSLPPFIWKKMAGEHVTWTRDFITVDEAEVKQLESMDVMERDVFEAYYAGERTWTTVLSDGTTVPLKHDGAEMPLLYDDRVAYITAVLETRMSEFDQQLGAMYRGLQQVVPEAVIRLLTWRELERRICGDPDISIDALRKSIHLEDLDEDEDRVQFLWETLKKFSVEDRSRFLRFVTGRRRLPALLSVYPNMVDTMNTLPESSTCSNILYLPNYTSAAAAEEKLRYAIYNCVAIDTDMSPWDDD